MRVLSKILIVLMLIGSAFGQDSYKKMTSTSPSSSSAVVQVGTGIQYHQVTFTTSGTVSTCTVKIEQSATGSGGWSDLIGATTCTSNGSSAITSGVANYIRITFTALSGGGSVTAVYDGWVAAPITPSGTLTANRIVIGNGGNSIKVAGADTQYDPVTGIIGFTKLRFLIDSGPVAAPAGTFDIGVNAGGFFYCVNSAGASCLLPAGVTNNGTLTNDKVIVGDGTTVVTASLIDYDPTWQVIKQPYYLFSTDSVFSSNPPAGEFLLGIDSGTGLLRCIDDAGASCDPAGSGTGDVVGPGSATDNAIARYDSTTGKLIQNSGVIIDDSNNITGVTSMTTSSGGVAGFLGCGQGTAQSTVANTFAFTCGSSITAWLMKMADAAGSGLLLGTNSSSIVTQSFVNTSAGIFGAISDETGGGGVLVGSAGPTFTGTTTVADLTISGTCTGCGGSVANNTFASNARSGVGQTAPNDTTHIKLFGIPNLGAVTFSTITFNVVTGDGSNNYTAGIYEDVAGTLTLICGTTPQVMTSGTKTLSCSGTTTAGRKHYFAWAGAATTATIDYDNASFYNFHTGVNGSGVITGGAALPANGGTTPSDSVGVGVPVLLLK